MQPTPQRTREGTRTSSPLSLLYVVLHPDGVCLASPGCPSERWSLTPPFHLYPDKAKLCQGKSIFCDTFRYEWFALHTRPAIKSGRHPALECPDFPHPDPPWRIIGARPPLLPCLKLYNAGVDPAAINS